MISARYLLAAILITVWMPIAWAATIKAQGTLNAPPQSRILVIATDPVFQELLNEDFALPRYNPSNPIKILTLTVTSTQKVLEPGVFLSEVAPGVPHVSELLKAAGYTPTNTAAQEQPLPAGAQEYLRQQPRAERTTLPFYNLPGYPPGHEPMPLPRRFGNVPQVSQPDALASQNYDTALVVHAVLSNGNGQMTLVALAHPGEDLHQAKKSLAERVANALLH